VSDSLDWRQRAACRDEDPELFHPVGTSGPALRQLDAAKAVCRRCPGWVREKCLDHALATGSDYGVFGGMSADERRKLHRNTPRPPPPELLGAVRPECGSEAGYQRHHRRNEPKCRPCLNAMNDRRKARERAQRQEAVS
jgi:WhiB family redox-sensing transcriptional regulator